jgi:hypothetical protein
LIFNKEVLFLNRSLGTLIGMKPIHPLNSQNRRLSLATEIVSSSNKAIGFDDTGGI